MQTGGGRIASIGQGYVGLPVSMRPVVVSDNVDKRKVRGPRRGESTTYPETTL